MTPAPLNWALPVQTVEAPPRRVRVIEPPYVFGPDDDTAVVEWDTEYGLAVWDHCGTPLPGDPSMPHLRNVPGGWPVEITVPAPAMRGRITIPTPGDDEGDLCLRLDWRGETCLGSLVYLPDEDLGGCGCSTMRMPPCGYCTSTLPECPRCGWREDE